MTDDLTRWLLEQVAEDERIAHVQAEHEDDWARELEEAAKRGNVPSVALDDVFWSGRVLAECEAKRRIIDRCREARAVVAHWIPAGPTHESAAAFAEYAKFAEQTLRVLALPYADRPGYREEWKP